MTEEEIKQVIEVKMEVDALCKKFHESIEEFFKKELPFELDYNERFLIVSRAINATGVSWFDNFWKQFNPEWKMLQKENKGESNDR